MNFTVLILRINFFIFNKNIFSEESQYILIYPHQQWILDYLKNDARLEDEPESSMANDTLIKRNFIFVIIVIVKFFDLIT